MDVTVESKQRTVLLTDWWFPSAGHDEALARLDYVVERGWPSAELTGTAGTGKSRLAARFAEEQRRRGTAVAELDVSHVPPESLPLAVLEALGVFGEATTPWQRLRDACIALQRTRSRAVVVCDHVSDASRLAAVNRLSRACGESLTTIAVGRTIAGRGLRVELGAWNREETGCFLDALGEEVGCTFANAVKDSLHAVSRGVPQALRRHAELALLAARGRSVTPTMTRGVAHELHA